MRREYSVSKGRKLSNVLWQVGQGHVLDDTFELKMHCSITSEHRALVRTYGYQVQKQTAYWKCYYLCVNPQNPTSCLLRERMAPNTSSHRGCSLRQHVNMPTCQLKCVWVTRLHDERLIYVCALLLRLDSVNGSMMKDWFVWLLCSWDWKLRPRKASRGLQLQVPVLPQALREAGKKDCRDSQDRVNVCVTFPLLFLYVWLRNYGNVS